MTAARLRLTFDTNILIYAVDRAAGRRHDAAKRLVAQAVFVDSVLSLQSLAEFCHAVTRKKKLSLLDDAAMAVDAWQSVFPIVHAERDTLGHALGAVRAHGLSFWDAMLWATVRRAGCRLLVTEDFQNGRTLGGVRFVNPFGDSLPDELAAALRPD